MKKVLKFLVYVLALILVLATAFFFWASSPNHSEKDYEKTFIQANSQKTNNDSIYSIVTYNIGYLSGMTNNKALSKPKALFDENLNKVIGAFKSVDADIIAFQEIDYASARSYNVNQQEKIAAQGYNYTAQAVNWDERYVPFPYWPPSMHFGKVFSGQSILSNYPLKDHRRIVLQRVKNNPFYRDALYLERLAQVATITLENKDITIMNVHLEAFDKPTRVKQMDFVIELFNTFRKEHPTILLGDFNSLARDSTAAIHKLIRLPNVGNAAFDKENLQNTFSSINPFKRIDYIFYTENSIEMVNSKILAQFGQASDHLPVELQFRLK